MQIRREHEIDVAVAQAKPIARRDPAESFWRNLTEAELLEIQFTTSDPELLSGMSADLPPPGAVRVEFVYDLRGRAAGKASCVHCGFANHYRGFVMKQEDGTRRMVGRICGRNLYGADFDVLEKDFNAARDLADHLRRKNAILGAEAVLMRGIKEVLAAPSLAKFQDLRRALRRVFPGTLGQDLANIASRGLTLSIVERIRDLQAEERRDDAEEQHAVEMKNMSKVERKRFRREMGLRGGDFLRKFHARWVLSQVRLFSSPSTRRRQF
jgi:hypothetical protein